jgi:CubicO group peptidase (beta-lactamase class C family)
MAASSIPAIGVAVADGNHILWEEGFGSADRENGISATAHTPFYVASVTKAITGTAVMLLNEHHRLELDRPVNNYLGSAKVHSPMWDPAGATIRRVATHTAGLTTYNRKCALQDTSCRVSTDTAIQHYGILFWPPGDHFDYSNLGYGILGEIVSRVSGRSYGDFIERELFGPLGMEDCFLEPRSGRPESTAAQYDSTSHERTPIQLSDTPGASSVHCSAHDLALFGMFALGMYPPGQKQVLSDASLRMMLNPTVKTGEGERYGFGWSLQPNHHGYLGVFAQGGTNDSFAVLQLIPSEKITIAVVANMGTTVPLEIVEEVLSELLPRYRESSIAEKAATTRTERPVTKALVGRWTGALHTWNGNFPLTLEIAGSRDVQAKWDSGHWMKATDVDIAEPRFYCIIHGLKGIPGAPQSPYDLELELYLRAKTLVGAGTTKDDAQLPYWIQLEKSAASLQGSVAVPRAQLQRDPSCRSACGSLIEPRKSAQ